MTTPEVIKPEWWFYVSFRWLKLFSLTVGRDQHAGSSWRPCSSGPGSMPALRKVTGIKDISIYIGILATFALIGLTVWEAVVAH